MTKEKRSFKVLDLFSGAGGFSAGLHMLPEFKTVVATDIMADSLETFAYNFPETKVILGDICDIKIKKQIIEESKKNGVNMIIGGPPCQGFSNKGKKLGLCDPRNFLFREYLDIVKQLKPDVFVIENVKALMTSTNGWFLQEILKQIEILGYHSSYGVLTASDFGVPQDRQRTIIIASKNDIIQLPIKKLSKKEKTTVRDAISDLVFLESGQGDEIQNYKYKARTQYQKDLRIDSTVLFNHKATNHSKIALSKLAMIPPQGGKENLPEKLHGNQKFKTTWGRLKWDKQSPTIDTRFDTPSNGTNSHPELNRSITPREAARIQSFPDRFRFLGSKTNICKQIGNAVPPLLGKAIGEAILEAIDKRNFRLFNGDALSVLDNLIKWDIKVDHVITDPPYNISQKNNFSTMKSAKRKGVDFGEWDKNFDSLSWIPKAAKLIRNGGSFIIFNSYRNLSFIVNELESNGLEVKDILKWIKKNPMPRNINRRYVQDTEFAIWAVKPKKPWVFNRPENSKYLRAEFRTSTVSGKERLNHPTQKSLKLMEDIISIHTNVGDSILDPFMGSGTTGVAALNLGRSFIGIEIEPKYFLMASDRIKKRK